MWNTRKDMINKNSRRVPAVEPPPPPPSPSAGQRVEEKKGKEERQRMKQFTFWNPYYKFMTTELDSRWTVNKSVFKCFVKVNRVLHCFGKLYIDSALWLNALSLTSNEGCGLKGGAR